MNILLFIVYYFIQTYTMFATQFFCGDLVCTRFKRMDILKFCHCNWRDSIGVPWHVEFVALAPINNLGYWTVESLRLLPRSHFPSSTSTAHHIVLCVILSRVVSYAFGLQRSTFLCALSDCYREHLLSSQLIRLLCLKGSDRGTAIRDIDPVVIPHLCEGR